MGVDIMEYERNTPFTEGLFKILKKIGRVEVWECVQVEFDKLLKGSNWERERDYERREKLLSKGRRGKHIESYIYEVKK